MLLIHPQFSAITAIKLCNCFKVIIGITVKSLSSFLPLWQLSNEYEGDVVCATHHRGQTTCPPGHLQHPMSQEGKKIIKDNNQPSHCLFTQLLSRM